MIPKKGEKGNKQIVKLSHAAVVNCLTSLKEEPGLKAQDIILYHNSFSSGYELIELFLPLIVGAQVVVFNETGSDKLKTLRKTINDYKITSVLLSPSQWNKLLEANWKPEREIKAFSSGELLRHDIGVKLLNSFKEVWNLYGTLETSVFSSVNKVSSASLSFLGKAIKNTDIIIVDKYLQPVPVDVPGEILVAGLGLSKEYYNEATIPGNGTDSAKFFRTGDLGKITLNGDIEFISPVKQLIHIRDFKFDPKNVEKIIIEDPYIKDSAVKQFNSSGKFSGFVAYLLISNPDGVNRTNELVKNLRRYLRTKLPDYMIPERFVIVDEIPLTKYGFVNYNALPLPDQNENEYEDYVAPRNKTEETLASIWQEILKMPKVSVKDSFFDLGGQSLMAVRLFNQIEKEFGQRFPLAMLYKASSIEDLANKIINKEDKNTEWPSLIPIQPQGSNTPLFLVHGAGGNVLLYNALAKHLEPDYPLYGLQSQGLDGQSKPLETIEEMAERYLNEIKTVQPHGPYFLGGYCMGGTIAYEMAQKLINSGEQVSMVAMLDTYNFVKALKVSFTEFIFQKLKFHVKNFTQLRPSEMLSYFKEKKRIAGDGGWDHIRTEMPGTTLQEESFGRAESGIEASVQSINDHAGDIYFPKPYPGSLTLFKPQKNYSFYPDPQMGWGDLALGGLDIVELPVNPHAMLVEPYVTMLASEIKKRLGGLNFNTNVA